MPARTNRVKHDPKTIEKIRCSQLINHLVKHALGENEMQSSQVTAALGLIKKVIPDLAATQLEVSGENGGPIQFQKVAIELVDSESKDTE